MHLYLILNYTMYHDDYILVYDIVYDTNDKRISDKLTVQMVVTST